MRIKPDKNTFSPKGISIRCGGGGGRGPGMRLRVRGPFIFNVLTFAPEERRRRRRKNIIK